MRRRAPPWARSRRRRSGRRTRGCTGVAHEGQNFPHFSKQIPSFSKENPNFSKLFPRNSKHFPWRFPTKSTGWRRRPAISPFSSLAARIARWLSVLLSSLRPRARRSGGDPGAGAVANPGELRFSDYRDFCFSARQCRAGRRRRRGDAVSGRAGGATAGRASSAASTWGRQGARAPDALAARVYKGRRPVAGANRSVRRHSPSISWRRKFRLKRAVKGAQSAPPAAARHGFQVNGHFICRISRRKFIFQLADFLRVLTLAGDLLARTRPRAKRRTMAMFLAPWPVR